MNCNNSNNSLVPSAQPIANIPEKPSDNTVAAGVPLIPREHPGPPAPETKTVPLTDFTITRVDVNPEPAAKKARLEIPNVLSQPGTIAQITPEALTSCFQVSCNSDDGEKLARLLSNTDEKTRKEWFSCPLSFSDKKDTPIIYAARRGHAAVVETLIDHQANPCENNPFSSLQSSALTIAAQENQAKVIQVMTKSKQFDPDNPRKDGITGLIMAIKKGYAETTKILLEHKANPNYKIRCAGDDKIGFRSIGNFGEGESIPPGRAWYTPVMSAIEFGNHIILEQLLANGGDPNNIDPANPIQQSPLFMASFSRTPAAAKMIRLLLNCGANMHERIAPCDETIRNLTQEKTQLHHTLLELTCFCSAKESDHESQLHHNAQILCDHFRTTGGQSVERSILKWFYTGQGFLKSVVLISDCCEKALTRPSLTEYLIRNLSLLTSLLDVFGNEESSESQDDKYQRAINCAEETRLSLHEDLKSTDSAQLRQMVEEVLDKFNDYNMDFNDEVIKKFLKANEKIEVEDPALKKTEYRIEVSSLLLSLARVVVNYIWHH
ncbi:ankyrin repeat domain-containing protein [Thalassotalea sp. G20_0]|uniref:ankyrin repeat domain-containing protein n=1 Tax=Thalassotalea sp. G20_0 TaxID=2821093 RepID=UPI001ADA8E1C|nr:ankyrin repeat domain-containing protein [Thalassotalea sp. G20_0]MBO9493774.1 ankyrin repeat domain-containing protein [Thalassotalea sp. G20_0]